MTKVLGNEQVGIFKDARRALLADAKSAGNETWQDPENNYPTGGFLSDQSLGSFNHLPYRTKHALKGRKPSGGGCDLLQRGHVERLAPGRCTSTRQREGRVLNHNCARRDN